MGGDYGLYEKNYYYNGELEFYKLLKNKELIYNLLARIFIELSFEYVHFAIFLKILTIILIYAFIHTCFKNKFLISALFFSFYIYCLALGIVRQGLAISFFLILLIFWKKLNIVKFVCFISLVSLIHITSAFLIILKLNLKNFIKLSIIILLFMVIYFITFGIDHFFGLIDVYIIRREHFSYGFFFRFSLILPILLMFFKHKEKISNSAYFDLFKPTVFIAIPLLIFVAFANPTISDRLLFYLFPVFFIILDRLIEVIKIKLKIIYTSFFLLLNFTFLNVWLTLGNNTKFFIPIKHLFQ